MANIGSLVVDLQANSAAFLQEMQKARQASEQTARGIQAGLDRMSAAMRSAETYVRGFVASFTVDRIVTFAAAATRAAGELDTVAARLGTNAQALQVYRLAAAQAGVGQEQLTGALSTFSRFIGEAMNGGQEQIDQLNRWGLRILDVHGRQRDFNAILANFSDILARLPSRQAQQAAATKAMGDAGAALVPVLARGSAGLRDAAADADRLGVVLGQDVLEGARRFNAEMEVLQLRLQAATVRPFTEFFAELSRYVSNSASEVRSLVAALQWLADRVPGLSSLGGINPTAGITGGPTGIPYAPGTAPLNTPVILQQGQVSQMERQLEVLRAQRDEMERNVSGFPQGAVAAWEAITDRIDALARRLFEARERLAALQGQAAAGVPAAAAPGATAGGPVALRGFATIDGVTGPAGAFGVGVGGSGARNPTAQLSLGDRQSIAATFRALAEQQALLSTPNAERVSFITSWIEKLPQAVSRTGALAERVRNLAGAFYDAQQRNAALNDAYEEGTRISEQMMTQQERLRDQLDRLNFLRDVGAISQTTYNRAVADAWLKTSALGDAVQGLGDAFSSAFEAAIVKGESLRNVMGNLLADVGRLLVRLAVLEPIKQAITQGLGSLFGGSSGSGAGGGHSSSAWGNVLSPRGPIALAGGGVVTSPHIALIGEGAMNEAVVPLPDGRRIPVQLSGRGGGGNTFVTQIDARGSDAGVLIRVQAMLDQRDARLLAAIPQLSRDGGGFARSVGARKR